MFKEKFRVFKQTVEYILRQIGPELQHPTNRNPALSPTQQLLTCLHWMRTGVQYHAVADITWVGKSHREKMHHKSV